MSCVQVFLLYVKVGTRNAVVEDALGNLQLRTFLLHRDEQLRELYVGMGHHHVLKEERDACDERGDDDE